MFRQSLLVAIGIVLIQASQSLAIPKDQIAQKINCNDPQGTPEEKYCSNLSYEAADKRLNQVYQRLISRVRGEEKKLLVNAQLAWIKFRDNTCQFAVYPSRDGTGYIIFYNDCAESLTRQRTADFEKYISDRISQ